MFSKLALASLAFSAICSALPVYVGAPDVVSGTAWYSSNLNAGSTAVQSGYKCYGGIPSAYPKFSQWLSFNKLWSNNLADITNNNGGNTQIVGWIKSSILSVAQASNVDPRMILAIVLQESSGNANVQCTGTAPDMNCGLMQGPFGSVGYTGGQASVLNMITEGVQGTSTGGDNGVGGPGYAQYMGTALSWVVNPYPGNPYAAARAYNSGSVTGTCLDDIVWGTASYANDIANRLLGWKADNGDPFSTQCV